MLFNKIRVHSYDTVLCWFVVSLLASLIGDNDAVNDRCVGVTTSGSGLWSGFTAYDRSLGLCTDNRLGLRLGLCTVARGRSTSARGRSGATATGSDSFTWSPVLLGQKSIYATNVRSTDFCVLLFAIFCNNCYC